MVNIIYQRSVTHKDIFVLLRAFGLPLGTDGGLDSLDFTVFMLSEKRGRSKGKDTTLALSGASQFSGTFSGIVSTGRSRK
jgi:hypothetical protein